MRIVFDIETNGIDATELFSFVALDADTGALVANWGPDDAHKGVALINEADEVIGHYILSYDLPMLQRLVGGVRPKKVTDTVALSRLMYADIKESDFNRPASFPKTLIGSHGLEAWGHRLGLHKIGLDVSFDHWSQELQDRCVRDCEVNLRLYQHMMINPPSPKAVEIEHRVMQIVRHMETEGGWCFDVDAALKLQAVLLAENAEIEAKLRIAFPPKWHALGEFTPKTNAPKYGYTKDTPLTKIERMAFNAASREEIAQRLIDKYAWKPTVFSDKTERPTIDEDVLDGLDYPEAPMLNRYLLVQKRLGAIATGREAWLKVYKPTPYGPMIRGRYNPNGAVTGRASHFSPNITQVPKVNSPFGPECRAMFHCPPGAVLIGTDLSGLELRCLAHYAAAFDGGAYGHELLNGDIHTKVKDICELPSRDNAKTLKYALIYGAGDGKLGKIVGGAVKEGRRLRDLLMTGLPVLKQVSDAVTNEAKKGYVLGLDGRRITVRAVYKALNTKLQGAGAIIAKQWMINVWVGMNRLGLVPGRDFWFACWAHDEINIVLLVPDRAAEVMSLCKTAANEAGRQLGVRVPIDADAKLGRTWADVH